MQTAQERVDAHYNADIPTRNMLDPEQALALLLAAVRKYKAYGELEHHAQQRQAHEKALETDPHAQLSLAPVDKDLPLADSEWGVIEPLWQLYMERERALMVEATRIMGDVSHGRMSSEIQADITLYEGDMHVKAFVYGIVTV